MSGMDVAVVDSGGRGDALVHVLGESDGVNTVYGLSGNAGTDLHEKGVSVSIRPTDIRSVVDFALQEQLGLVVVGPEAPAIAGLGDALRAAGILTICPSAETARLEGSKIQFQEFAEKHGIVVPEALCIARSAKEALNFVEHNDPRDYVAKAAGEAGGKGVGVYDSAGMMRSFVRGLLNGDFNNAAKEGIVFQRRRPKKDPEVSTFTLVDKNGNCLELPAAQDHKREFEGDEGRNTGGMGAYSDVPTSIYTLEQRQQNTKNNQKFAEGTKMEGLNSETILFQGRMGEVVLEFGVRFGDPEGQVVLPRLQRAGVDMHEVFLAQAHGRLDTINLPQNIDEAAVAFCLAAKFYPGTPAVGDEIFGLGQDYGEDIMIYHGGTLRADDNTIRTAGGRALWVVAYGEDVADARSKGLKVIGQENNGVYFRGMHYRSDIGHQAA